MYAKNILGILAVLVVGWMAGAGLRAAASVAHAVYLVQSETAASASRPSQSAEALPSGLLGVYVRAPFSPPGGESGAATARAGGRSAAQAGAEDLAATEAVFRALSEAGIRLVGIRLEWEWVEPRPGDWNWTAVDKLVELAAKNHLRLLGVLGGVPRWASTAPSKAVNYGDYPPLSWKDWGEYAGQLARRYRTVAVAWRVLDNPYALSQQVAAWTPATYARALGVAYTAIHGADPKAKVLAGLVWAPELSPPASAYYRALVQDRAYPLFKHIDAFSLRPGRIPPPRLAAWLEEAHKQVSLFGGGRPLPVWVDGIAYPSDARWQDQKDYQKGPSSQAAWLLDVLAVLTRGRSVERVLWSYGVDAAGGAASEGATSGLLGFARGPAAGVGAGTGPRLEAKPALQAYAAALRKGLASAREAAGQPAAEKPWPGLEGTLERNVPYGVATGVVLRLDLYLPPEPAVSGRAEAASQGQARGQAEAQVRAQAQPELQSRPVPERGLAGPALHRPLIIYVHGGGWQHGDKSDWTRMVGIRELMARGFVVATVDYRLAPQFRFPAQLEDVREAIRYLCANAARYGIDPQRVGLMGDSAGGHLVALLGLTQGNEAFGSPGVSAPSGAARVPGSFGSPGPVGPAGTVRSAGTDRSAGSVRPAEAAGTPLQSVIPSARIRAVVDLFGPTDLTAALSPHEFQGWARAQIFSAFGVSPTQPDAARLLRAGSPLTYVRKDAPAFLIIHGERDGIVPLHQSVEFYERLKAAGARAMFVPVRNAGHELKPDGGPIRPSRAELGRMIVDFFVRELAEKS